MSVCSTVIRRHFCLFATLPVLANVEDSSIASISNIMVHIAPVP